MKSLLSLRLLRRRRITRLPLKNYQELLHFSPLAFDSSCLQLFNLVMQLKFLCGLFRQSDPIIGHAQPVMGLAKLWVRLDCLGVKANRLFRLVLGKIENPKLQVSVAAFRVDRHRFGKQGFHLVQGLLGPAAVPAASRWPWRKGSWRANLRVAACTNRASLGSMQANGLGAAISILPMKL